MSDAPPLADGETVVFDHIPSLAKFKRTAVMVLAISLVPTAVFAVVFPDTYWVILPMFLSCILLVQERFKLGRHRAWITDRRIILQDGIDIVLTSVTDVKTRSIAVGVRHGADRQLVSLFYPPSGAVLARAIEDAKGASDVAD